MANTCFQIIKILHRPSLTKWMLHGSDYLRYPGNHPSIDVLGASVCYLAVSSMTETECLAVLDTEKEKAMIDCRRDCEVTFEKSSLLTTRDITVLQAFVLYLQMRKRLWLTICLMDFQNALAQASKPLVDVEEIIPSLQGVSHCNDADFDPATPEPIPDREGITDITYALIKYHLVVFGRRMGDGSNNAPSSSIGLRLDWEVAQQHVREFEGNVLRLLHFCDPESSSYVWFVWHGTQLFIAGARLSALRPLYRAGATRQPAPPRPKDNTEILQQTVKALEKMELMHTDPRGENYRWMVSIQWHILAVAIAECYVCPDEVLVERAWALIESLYQRYEALITRNSGKTLQGPLGKLMRRTREKLEASSRGCTQPSTARSGECGRALPTVADLSIMPNNESANQMERRGQPYSTPEDSTLPGEQVTLSSTAALTPDSSIWDQSWQMWDEFMVDMSFDELDGQNPFF